VETPQPRSRYDSSEEIVRAANPSVIYRGKRKHFRTTCADSISTVGSFQYASYSVLVNQLQVHVSDSNPDSNFKRLLICFLPTILVCLAMCFIVSLF